LWNAPTIHKVLYPIKLDGKRDQNSVILASKAVFDVFDEEGAKELTALVEAELDSSSKKKVQDGKCMWWVGGGESFTTCSHTAYTLLITLLAHYSLHYRRPVRGACEAQADRREVHIVHYSTLYTVHCAILHCIDCLLLYTIHYTIYAALIWTHALTHTLIRYTFYTMYPVQCTLCNAP
jgi:hypothetical protein